MADFPNPYNIPDQEYYMRRYINDLPDPLARLDLELVDDLNNWLDAFQHSMTIFTSCRPLAADVEYSDNWNRTSSFDLGANWQQFFRLGTVSYQILDSQLRSFTETGAFSRTGGAWFSSFPDTTHQISQLTFKGATQLSIPTAPNDIILGGGPCVRMAQSGIGSDWETNVKCYNMYYQETRSSTPPYSITNNNLGLIHLNGAGGSNDLDIQILATPLVDGDILKLTAMNFLFFGTPFVCLRGYVNDVQRLSANVNLLGATGIISGRAGIGTTGAGSDASFAMDWEDWKGYTAIPI